MFQLVNIGSQYSYSSDDQSEFLVVVSKDFDEAPCSPSEPTNKQKVLYHELTITKFLYSIIMWINFFTLL